MTYANPNDQRAINRQIKYRKESWLRYSVSSAFYNAKRRCDNKGIPFELVYSYIDTLVEESKGKCAISGLEFKKSGISGVNCPRSPSIDRIIPSVRYVKGNVRLILHGLNSLKGSNETDHDLIEICKAVSEKNA